MKKYIYILFILSFGFSNSHLYAQSSERLKNVEHTVADNVIDYSIAVMSEGLYSVVLLNPSGEAVGWPIKDKKYGSGSHIEFTVNSKYWTKGEYRLQVIQNEKAIDLYRINVGLSKREQARLKKVN